MTKGMGVILLCVWIRCCLLQGLTAELIGERSVDALDTMKSWDSLWFHRTILSLTYSQRCIPQWNQGWHPCSRARSVDIFAFQNCQQLIKNSLWRKAMRFILELPDRSSFLTWREGWRFIADLTQKTGATLPEPFRISLSSLNSC